MQDKNLQKIESLKKLAKEAKDLDDRINARKYYEQLLIEDPDDWEGNFYPVYYEALAANPDEFSNVIVKFNNAVKQATIMIKNSVDKEKHIETYDEILVAVAEFDVMIVDISTKLQKNSSQISTTMLNNWNVPCISMLIMVGDYYLELFEAPKKAAMVYRTAKVSAQHTAQYSKLMDDLLTEATKKEQEVLAMLGEM